MKLRTGQGMAPSLMVPTQVPARVVGRRSSRLAAISKSALERAVVMVFLIVGAALTLAWTTFLGLVVFKAGQWALG
jgi:hypothetical protein